MPIDVEETMRQQPLVSYLKVLDWADCDPGCRRCAALKKIIEDLLRVVRIQEKQLDELERAKPRRSWLGWTSSSNET